MRRFVNVTCAAFRTQELPRETAARGRRKAAMAAKTSKPPPSTAKKSSARSKYFNLCTYKLHALADYAKTIRLFGTTDNYNSQVVRFTQRIFSLFKTELKIRENLSIDASSVSTPERTRLGSPNKSQSTSGGNDYFTTFRNHPHLKITQRQLSAFKSQIHCLIRRQLFTIISQTQTVTMTT